MNEAALWRRLLAELLGSAFLAAVVIGSGIAAQHLSPGNVGLELLENAAATAAGLYALILMFGPVSGAHFNPVVSVVDAAFDGLRWRDACAYLPAQVAGCVGGAVIANLMFSRAAVSISTHHRASSAHFLSEIVATLGLILVIFALARSGRSSSAPPAVGAYIGAAYFFTSSTSFANPAITVGRMFSNTFAGIAPSSAPSFVVAQVLGGALALLVVKTLYPGVTPSEAADIIFPHHVPDATDAEVRVSAPDMKSQLEARTSDGASGVTAHVMPLHAAGVGEGHERPVCVDTGPPEGPGDGGPGSATERLETVIHAEDHSLTNVPAVLFLCVHNAGRSQMALGWFTHLAGDRAVAWSGGSDPASEINNGAVAAMAEIGIDISMAYPKPWTDEFLGGADVVVTMGCGDACPLVPGKRYEDWELDDPAGKSLAEIRTIRDEIGRRVSDLLRRLKVPLG